jgi:hypothetical protein
MSSTLRLGYTGHHHPDDEVTFDGDLPMSSLKAVTFNLNSGHLHDAHAPYLVNMYGLGIALADSAGDGRYIRTFVFPMPRCSGGTPIHLDCRVLVGVEGGTASTTLRIVPYEAPFPANDDAALAVFVGATTTTEAAWVIDDSDFCIPKQMPATEWPVLHGDGTLRGTGRVWLARAEVDVTVEGATSGDWFGVGAVQIRGHVYTP